VRTWVAQLQPDLAPAKSIPAPQVTRDRRARIVGSSVVLAIGGRVVMLRGHTDDVLSAEISRDGTRAVTASVDGDARIWDTRTGKTIWVLRGHAGTVFDASFSPDGRLVVTGGPSTAGLWDATTGDRIYFLKGDGGAVLAAAFLSPTRIVTRGHDGVRTFDCDTCGDLADLLALADRRLSITGRTLTPDEQARFVGG
jgi:WD40 repeat protein